MVHIVTGQINEGKTTKLLSIFNELKRRDKTKCGDGFINRKIFADGENAGQEIMRLSTGEKCNFSFKEKFIPDSWSEKYRFGAYSFSNEGFDFAEKIVMDIIRDKTEPVFIDEIGPLELQGKGFFHLFSELLKEKMELYAAVRESCVEDVIQLFLIEEYKILRV